MPRKRATPVLALYAIAEAQQGYFTTRQAVQAGYQFGSQAHHVKVGNWMRTVRGIYRLARFPRPDEEQLVIYSLWSCNRAGIPEGVFSHQTALEIHKLSDRQNSKLHMTVPIEFRRSAKPPSNLMLHYANLTKKDVEQRHGFCVTRPFRTIVDLTTTGCVTREIITRALVESRNRKLISARELTSSKRRSLMTTISLRKTYRRK
jgi:predicted transcriptional regulator of viral defense system